LWWACHPFRHEVNDFVLLDFVSNEGIHRRHEPAVASFACFGAFCDSELTRTS
jgi:hypothetical protein